MKNDKPRLPDGQILVDWELLWVKVPGGLRQSQRQLRDKIGLYRVTFRGDIVVIGMGTDRKGGLAKRFSDFRRPSPSGRNHHAGRLIYEHRDEVELEVLITGDRHSSPDTAKQLKTLMIEKHKPAWTAPARCRPAIKSARKTKSKKAGPNTKMQPYTGPVPSLAPPSENRDNPT